MPRSFFTSNRIVVVVCQLKENETMNSNNFKNAWRIESGSVNR